SRNQNKGTQPAKDAQSDRERLYITAEDAKNAEGRRDGGQKSTQNEAIFIVGTAKRRKASAFLGEEDLRLRQAQALRKTQEKGRAPLFRNCRWTVPSSGSGACNRFHLGAACFVPAVSRTAAGASPIREVIRSTRKRR